VPFYGESSFLMYRKDVFERLVSRCRGLHLAGGRRRGRQAGRPRHVRHLPARKPGWGEVLAPLDTVINTFGGRWFDELWNAQLTSPKRTGCAVLCRPGTGPW